MRSMSPSPTGVRRIGALMLIGLQACTGWEPVTEPVPEFVEHHPTSLIRLTTTQSQLLLSNRSRVRGDSLYGQVRGFGFTVALADITGTKAHRVNLVGTTLLAGAAGLLVGATISIARDPCCGW